MLSQQCEQLHSQVTNSNKHLYKTVEVQTTQKTTKKPLLNTTKAIRYCFLIISSYCNLICPNPNQCKLFPNIQIYTQVEIHWFWVTLQYCNIYQIHNIKCPFVNLSFKIWCIKTYVHYVLASPRKQLRVNLLIRFLITNIRQLYTPNHQFHKEHPTQSSI